MQYAEAGIVAIILVLFYQFIIALMELLTGLLVYMSVKVPVDGGFITFSIIFPVVLYLYVIYLLIRYRKQLARLIAGKEAEGESFSLNLSGTWLLHVAIITVCLITVLSEIPVIISYLVNGRSNEAGSENGMIIQQTMESTVFRLAVIKAAFALVILLLSKRIAGFWRLGSNAE